VCVRNCLIFFVFEYSSVWPEICRVLSQIQWRFFRGISGKNYFGRIFQKFCPLPRLSSTKTCEISPYFVKFYSGSVLRWKKFTQVLSYVVCTQVRRHVHKKITKRRYGGEKQGRFCFRKTSFVHSRSWTSYALLLGYLGLKFLPDVRHCVYWVFAEIWALDSSHKIGNKFFVHHCQGWKEGSSVCETVWFFSWVNTHPFDLKFVAFCPKFSGDSFVEFQEKTISGEFFRNFVLCQGYPLPKLVKFRPTFWNLILGPYCDEKIHTSTFICCLHPGKEARP